MIQRSLIASWARFVRGWLVISALLLLLFTHPDTLTALHAQDNSPSHPSSTSSRQPPTTVGENSPSQIAAGEITAVRLGFQGRFKVGFWTPLWIELRGVAADAVGRVEVTTADSDGIPVTFTDEAVVQKSADGTALGIWAYVKIGRPEPELAVLWQPTTGEPLRRRFDRSQTGRSLPSSQYWIVTIGDPAGFDENTRQLVPDSLGHIGTTIRDPRELPDRWYGYEGVDLVVLTTSRPEVIDGLTSSSSGARFAALDRWLRLGGHLIWSVGNRGAELLSEGAPLATWSPGRFVEVGTLRRASVLESYAGASQRLETAAGPKGAKLEVTTIADVRGRVLAPEGLQISGENPLVVAYPHGLGQATFVAFDLEQPLITKWAGRSRLISRIFHRNQTRTEELLNDRQGQVTHLGFDDLVGQLHSSLDQFSTVQLVPFSSVVGLLALYIALIGPIDYFLWKKLSRPHWTWASLGLVIVGFVGLSYFLQSRWKERQLKVNQVDVVDIDLDSRMARGTTWANIYSPETKRFNLSLVESLPLEKPVASRDVSAAAQPRNFERLLSWQGVPGRGLGGLNAETATSPFRQSYRVAVQPEESQKSDVEGLPIQVTSTKAISGRWWVELPAIDPGRLRAESLESKLEGDLVNPLATPLTEWFIVYHNWVYRGDRELGAGDRVAMTDFKATRYLDWQLTRRRVTSENKDLSTPWDQASLDVPRITEMLMFHESAGGSSYTRLTHRYQAYVDLSDQLRMGRAMLIGRARTAATELRNDGEPFHEAHDLQATFYRILLPVTLTKNEVQPVRRPGS
ncbi:MAG: hypothetical protein ACKOBW_09870 [Planctomycetota bacterium]